MSVEFHCPACGKKLFSYEPRARRYEKMIKECKKCGGQYLDPRSYELAMSGIPEDEFKISSYLVVAAFGGILAWRGLYLFQKYQLGVPGFMQKFLPTVFLIMGVVLVLAGIWNVISILTGLTKKKMDRLYQESLVRMRDTNYIYSLEKMGYAVPEKFKEGVF